MSRPSKEVLFHSRCAAESFQPHSSSAASYEELLSWWCRRCWEERHVRDAVDALKRQKSELRPVAQR